MLEENQSINASTERCEEFLDVDVLLVSQTDTISHYTPKEVYALADTARSIAGDRSYVGASVHQARRRMPTSITALHAQQLHVCWEERCRFPQIASRPVECELGTSFGRERGT